MALHRLQQAAGPPDRSFHGIAQGKRSQGVGNRGVHHRVVATYPGVELPRPLSLREFAERYPSTVELDVLLRLNAVESADTRLPTGSLVKRVAGGKLPE